MSRRFSAAKRAVTAEPITFELEYEVPDLTPDEETGRPAPGAMRLQVDEFACRGKVSVLLLAEFARQADIDAATPDGMALIADFFRQAFGAGEEETREYKRFFRVMSEHFDNDALMDVLAELVEKLAGRPSEQRSPLSAGPSTTGTSSTGDGSPAVGALEGAVVTLAGDGPSVATEITPEELAAVMAARKAPAASSTSTSRTSSTSSTRTSSTRARAPRKNASTAKRSTTRSKVSLPEPETAPR